MITGLIGMIQGRLGFRAASFTLAMICLGIASFCVWVIIWSITDIVVNVKRMFM